MLCKRPFVRRHTEHHWMRTVYNTSYDNVNRVEALYYPCGQCLPCRINKRREWTSRLLMESQCHSSSLFVTYTYDDEHIPSSGSLIKKDGQDYLKRLRKSLNGRKIRYFWCGEYGDTTFRPHYHAILFNISSEDLALLYKSWGKGYIYAGSVTAQSIGYVCGYVVKKMTKADDERLGGRAPEYCTMSRKPAIGSGYVSRLAGAVKNKYNLDDFSVTGELNLQFYHQGKYFPIGRTLKNKVLADVFDGDVESIELFKKHQLYQRFQRLYEEEYKKYYSEELEKVFSGTGDAQWYMNWVVRKNAQGCLKIEQRQKLFKGKGFL